MNPPEGWEYFFRIIKEMRSGMVAPVDVMGCHMLAAKDCSPKVFTFPLGL